MCTESIAYSRPTCLPCDLSLRESCLLYRFVCLHSLDSLTEGEKKTKNQKPPNPTFSYYIYFVFKPGHLTWLAYPTQAGRTGRTGGIERTAAITGDLSANNAATGSALLPPVFFFSPRSVADRLLHLHGYMDRCVLEDVPQEGRILRLLTSLTVSEVTCCRIRVVKKT